MSKSALSKAIRASAQQASQNSQWQWQTGTWPNTGGLYPGQITPVPQIAQPQTATTTWPMWSQAPLPEELLSVYSWCPKGDSEKTVTISVFGNAYGIARIELLASGVKVVAMDTTALKEFIALLELAGRLE